MIFFGYFFRVIQVLHLKVCWVEAIFKDLATV